jgi:2-alkyl-3-oxoalkanoate reductase
MRVLVTGAAGFLGREVIREAASSGHEVIAMVRPRADLQALGWDESIRVVRGDLRQRGEWSDQLVGVDSVIHLAAATSGDLGAQVAATLLGTENLLGALADAPLQRFVHVSSLSVYDYRRLPPGSVLDEASPIEERPPDRDAYTMTKLAQEQLVRSTCDRLGIPLVVLRPGAIYGPGVEWSHGAAVSTPRLAVVVSPRAVMPLTYVSNCADAVVTSLSSPHAPGSTVNIVDDDLPTHAQFFALCRSEGATSRQAVPVPWWLVDALGRGIDLVNRSVFGGSMKLPELLSHRRQHARWKPIDYDNQRARTLLDWKPEVPVDEGVRRMVSGRST